MITNSASPLVSVVIATFNMAQYLTLAVQSVLDQTHTNLEVLIVDDGSTDGTAAAVAPLLADPRVRYLHQSNGGQTLAKNHGVREASGDFIAFLDADDLWVRDKLQCQLPLFARPEVGVVYSYFHRIDAAGALQADNALQGGGNGGPGSAADIYRGRVSSALLVSNFVGFGTSVVRRECFDRLGSFDENLRMGIDYDLWLRFSAHYEFDFVPRALLKYRIWPGQMSKDCKTRYQTGIATMQRFLDRNPGLVDENTRREAWANTYVGYGECLRQKDGDLPAIRQYARALRFRPTYLPAWKAVVKSLIGWR